MAFGDSCGTELPLHCSHKKKAMKSLFTSQLMQQNQFQQVILITLYNTLSIDHCKVIKKIAANSLLAAACFVLSSRTYSKMHDQ